MRKSLIALSLVSVSLLGATACSGSTPEPVVKTKTVTVTETAPPVTLTKEKTPQSCLDAIDASENIADHVAQFADAMSEYPPLVQKAAEAGMNMDASALRSVTAKIDSINTRLDSATKQLKPDIADFNLTSAQCRDAK